MLLVLLLFVGLSTRLHQSFLLAVVSDLISLLLAISPSIFAYTKFILTHPFETKRTAVTDHSQHRTGVIHQKNIEMWSPKVRNPKTKAEIRASKSETLKVARSHWALEERMNSYPVTLGNMAVPEL